jgi:hypothetical protein
MPLPTIGTIVRYMPNSDQPNERFKDPLPAIITGIDHWMESRMSLTVFCRFGPPVALQNVPFDQGSAVGTWHWPPEAIRREASIRERLADVARAAIGDDQRHVASVGPFSVRARKAFNRMGIITVDDLVSKSADDLLALKNFGYTCLNEVIDKLARHGLALVNNVPTKQISTIKDGSRRNGG